MRHAELMRYRAGHSYLKGAHNFHRADMGEIGSGGGDASNFEGSRFVRRSMYSSTQFIHLSDPPFS